MSFGTSPKRIEVVDALRGFAIICILLLHCSNHFLYDEMPENSSTWLKALDAASKELLYFLFEGKAFGIFAILFGFTFGLQYFKALEKGRDFRLRFLWRMLLLAGFGIINAAFFAGGDPLAFMAIVAIILPLIAHFKTNTQLAIAIILFLQPLELYKATSLYFNPDYQSSNYTDSLYQLLKPYVVEGHFGAMLWSNASTGLKACLAWAFEYGRVSQTPALYIVGFLLYKHKLFARINHSFWNKLLVVSLIATPLLLLIKSMPKSAFLQIATVMWYNLSFIFLVVALFVCLYRRVFFQKITRLLQVYGRMSLTNFVFQSLMGSFLFYPYGLQLSAHCGIFVSILIGFAIAFGQILLSIWWLARFKQGPLEYLWHKWTYIM
jgi:uncharacterized protein